MIDVDLRELLPEGFLAMLGDEFTEAVLDDLAAGARAKWIRLAQQRLHASKQDYIQGIQPVTGQAGERTITLLGQLPNMIEQGVDMWDLRKTLLGEGKGKMSAEGKRYRAIPFRHGTPGSKGAVGAPMGPRYGPQGDMSRAHVFSEGGGMDSGQAAELGKRVYAAAKALRGKKRLKTTEGTPKGKSMIQVPKLAPHHTTSIYSGMQRVRKEYREATQSKYVTFRTISEANPEGWIHPGIKARNIHRDVEAHINEIMAKVVSTALRRSIGSIGI